MYDWWCKCYPIRWLHFMQNYSWKTVLQHLWGKVYHLLWTLRAYLGRTITDDCALLFFLSLFFVFWWHYEWWSCVSLSHFSFISAKSNHLLPPCQSMTLKGRFWKHDQCEWLVKLAKPGAVVVKNSWVHCSVAIFLLGPKMMIAWLIHKICWRSTLLDQSSSYFAGL